MHNPSADIPLDQTIIHWSCAMSKRAGSHNTSRPYVLLAESERTDYSCNVASVATSLCRPSHARVSWHYGASCSNGEVHNRDKTVSNSLFVLISHTYIIEVDTGDL